MRLALVGVAALVLAPGLGSAGQAPSDSGGSRAHGGSALARAAVPGGAGEPWRAEQVVEPAELARALGSGRGRKPVVLFVGFPLLYAGGHIAGARYVGPASRPNGLDALEQVARALPRDAEIVLYCGCCPWNVCPNIRPAFRLMQRLGFTRVKVLRIAVNFSHDWTGMGFPVEKGGASAGVR